MNATRFLLIMFLVSCVVLVPAAALPLEIGPRIQPTRNADSVLIRRDVLNEKGQLPRPKIIEFHWDALTVGRVLEQGKMTAKGCIYPAYRVVIPGRRGAGRKVVFHSDSKCQLTVLNVSDVRRTSPLSARFRPTAFGTTPYQTVFGQVGTAGEGMQTSVEVYLEFYYDSSDYAWTNFSWVQCLPYEGYSLEACDTTDEEQGPSSSVSISGRGDFSGPEESSHSSFVTLEGNYSGGTSCNFDFTGWIPQGDTFTYCQ